MSRNFDRVDSAESANLFPKKINSMSSNKQSIIKSFAWPVALVIAAGVIGHFQHTPVLAYIVGGLIWGYGVGYLAVLYSADAEEFMTPYYIQTAGFLTTTLWAAFAG